MIFDQQVDQKRASHQAEDEQNRPFEQVQYSDRSRIFGQLEEASQKRIYKFVQNLHQTDAEYAAEQGENVKPEAESRGR